MKIEIDGTPQEITALIDLLQRTSKKEQKPLVAEKFTHIRKPYSKEYE